MHENTNYLSSRFSDVYTVRWPRWLITCIIPYDPRVSCCHGNKRSWLKQTVRQASRLKGQRFQTTTTDWYDDPLTKWSSRRKWPRLIDNVQTALVFIELCLKFLQFVQSVTQFSTPVRPHGQAYTLLWQTRRSWFVYLAKLYWVWCCHPFSYRAPAQSSPAVGTVNIFSLSHPDERPADIKRLAVSEDFILRSL